MDSGGLQSICRCYILIFPAQRTLEFTEAGWGEHPIQQGPSGNPHLAMGSKIAMNTPTNPEASKAGEPRMPSARTLHGLDWLNFFLADVQTGVGPFLAIYLAGYKWNEERVGLALPVGGIAGILTQIPAGALVDRLRSKRALIAAGSTGNTMITCWYECLNHSAIVR